MSDAVRAFRNSIVDKLTYMVGKDPGHAQEHDWFVATALAVRDHVVDRWMDATRRTYRDGRKRVYYFSLEFLIGRLLFDSLSNLGITDVAREALRDLGVDLDRLRKIEPDAALGNGGLGRLAACYMESMASLAIPAHGYGIRYDHGIFRQALKDGWQIELPEDWLSAGNPWEFERPEVTYTVGFGGRVETTEDDEGTTRASWEPAESVNAVALRHAAHRMARASTSTRCGCGRRAHRTRCRWRTSTAATTSARWPIACGSSRSRASSIPATTPKPATSCGCGRSTSSRRRRCRTCCAGTRRSTASWRRSPTTCRSSSTTRIRRSRCRSSCGCSSTCTTCRGSSRGTSRRRCSTTRTTRCCRRRWKRGRCR